MSDLLSADLPMWAALPAAVLLICAGLLALTGSVGLLRLPTFYARMHAPTLAATLATIFTVAASMLVAVGQGQHAVFHQLLLIIFITITAPITAILLMRAVRTRRLREATPPRGNHEST